MPSEKTKQRIGIDARFYGPIGKGLGRYTKEIVDNVIALDTDNEYVIFLSRENFEEFQTKNPQVKKVLTPVKWYTLAEQIMMPYYIWRQKLDLVHFPHFNVPLYCPVKFVVTIHDLILTKYPTPRASTLSPFFYKLKNFAYSLVISSAIRRSARIIAVSEFTRNDIIEFFSRHNDDKRRRIADKTETIYEGVFRQALANLQNNDKDVLLRYNINSPYLLYVGNAYPHKNLEGLITIFLKVKQNIPQLSLVLVGKEDYFYNRLKNSVSELAGSNNLSIIFPGYIPDSDLPVVYHNAAVYVFPSLYEGFGLPPLEAMAQRCPVASSDRSCLPEVLGEAALYFDPENKEEAKTQIERLINDVPLREALIKKGLEQIKKYSWRDCGAKTLTIYNQL